MIIQALEMASWQRDSSTKRSMRARSVKKGSYDCARHTENPDLCDNDGGAPLSLSQNTHTSHTSALNADRLSHTHAYTFHNNTVYTYIHDEGTMDAFGALLVSGHLHRGGRCRQGGIIVLDIASQSGWSTSRCHDRSHATLARAIIASTKGWCYQARSAAATTTIGVSWPSQTARYVCVQMCECCVCKCRPLFALGIYSTVNVVHIIPWRPACEYIYICIHACVLSCHAAARARRSRREAKGFSPFEPQPAHHHTWFPLRSTMQFSDHVLLSFVLMIHSTFMCAMQSWWKKWTMPTKLMMLQMTRM
jgi:hypothetical protein